jgi:uncharacterized protein YdgA (DUF945 family)
MCMKKLAIAALVLAAAALVLPGIFGHFTQRQVDARIEQLRASEAMTATLTDYRRGWFSSTAKIELGLSPAQAAAMAAAGEDSGAAPFADAAALLELQLPVVVEISHGPLAFADGVHFGSSAMRAFADPDHARIASLQEALGMPYLFEFRGRSGFDGALDFNAHVPPIEQSTLLGQMSFSGATLTGTHYGRNLVTDLRIDTIDIDAGLMRFTVAGVRMRGDNEYLGRYIWLGPMDFEIRQVQMGSPMFGPEPALQGEALRAYSNNTLDASGTRLNAAASWAFTRLQVPNQPAFSDAEIAVTVSDIDVAALQAAIASMQQLATSNTAAEVSLRAVQPALARLMNAGPSLSIDPLTVRVDGRPLRASAHVAVNSGAMPPAAAFDLTDPMLLLRLVSIEAEASVDKSLVEEIATEISRTQILAAQAAGRPVDDDEVNAMAAAQANLILIVLMSQGMIQEDGDNYRAAVSIANGAVTVNGTTLPFGLPGLQ